MVVEWVWTVRKFGQEVEAEVLRDLVLVESIEGLVFDTKVVVVAVVAAAVQVFVAWLG